MVLCLMCHFSSYWGGGVPAILDIIYMCFYDMKARHKASLLTATRKLENIFRWWAGLDAGCW